MLSKRSLVFVVAIAVGCGAGQVGTGAGTKVHPDFGSDPTFGIPFDTVPGNQPRLPITFDAADESDPGPYPFPTNVPIEAGSDAHALVIDRDNCVLYESDATVKNG